MIRFPKVGIARGPLPIDIGQRIPECLGTFGATITDMNADNFSGVTVNGEPNPLFLLFISDERPHFVALDSQLEMSFCHHLYGLWDSLIEFVHIVLQPAFRDTDHTGNTR